jgi:hypothetical protein
MSNILKQCLLAIKSSFKQDYLEFFSILLFSTKPTFTDKKDLLNQVLSKAKYVLVQILSYETSFLFVPLQFSNQASDPNSYLHFISEFNSTDLTEFAFSYQSLETKVGKDNKLAGLERTKAYLLKDPSLKNLIVMAQFEQEPLADEIMKEFDELLDDTKPFEAGPSLVRNLNSFSLSQTLSQFTGESSIADWLRLSL